MGEILVETRVSIAIAVLAPFNCFDNPDGKQSLKGSPGIPHGEDRHTSLLTLPIMTMLIYPVNCCSITLFAERD